MFADAALDAIRHRGGPFIPKLLGIRSQVIPPERHTQQSAKLWVLLWLLTLALRLVLCPFGDRFTSRGVPAFVPEGFDVVE